MATTVTIDGVAATDVVVTDEGTLTAVVPEGSSPGAVDVTVTTSAGSDTLADGYTYVAAPTATSIDPDTGPEAGGTTVTLTGTGFDDSTTVTVGGVDATDIEVVDDTTVTFTTPPGTGTADVVVTTTGGSDTLADAFTYTPAVVVTAIDPDAGPQAGGNTVTITGSGFELDA